VERQEKGGSTYFFLALVTLAFLAAVLYLTFGANRTEQEGYTVQTERPAREEVAPERVPVNINTASAEELETVTGIGPVLAQAILDYRAEHGDFQTLDELLLRGIGSAKLDAMRDEINDRRRCATEDLSWWTDEKTCSSRDDTKLN